MTQPYTFCEDTVSDLHKDAYGFRPSESFWRFWAVANPEQKQAVWDDLLKAHECEMARYQAEQAKAVAQFQERISTLIDHGARDFETAIRWLHDALETNGDDEYLEYRLNIPYHYIAKCRKAI